MVRTAWTLFGREADLADEADALAIAVCHLARMPRTLGAILSAPSRSVPARHAALRSAVRRFGGTP